MDPVSTPGVPAASPTAVLRRVPLLRACWLFVVEWVMLSWLDGLCMLILGGVCLGFFYAPIPVTRTFPITFSGSGDIVYPHWAYPFRGWIIPSWLSGLVSIGGPMAVYVLAQVRIRSAWDASNAIMGSLWALLLGALFQVVIKLLIGGFRPYFLDVCMPDLSRADAHNKTGLNRVGFQHVMYTTEVCTQPDVTKLKTAITSFPSGHSTAAFAGFGFLFLWMNAKLKVWADQKPAFWKLALTMMPVLLALTIACSLTIDAAHNWYDIVAGSVIGTVMALASYRTSYAAVWDWRFNHLPLQRREAFLYGARGDLDYAAQTLARSAVPAEIRGLLPQQLDSASSSAVLTHRTDAVHVGEDDEHVSRQEQARSKRRVTPEGEAV